MIKTYRFRAYPNKQQEELIKKTFGCCRYVYNHYLAKRIEIYKNENKKFNYYECCADLTKLKKELTWLKEVDCSALQCSVKELDIAYDRFFRGISNFPVFKSKKNNNRHYRTTQGSDRIRVENNKIRLPKIGFVKIRDHRGIDGRIVNATVTQVPSGKYYISLCCYDVNKNIIEKSGKSIGIDLGIKNFATFSNGEIINNPKILDDSAKKLKRLQKELSRKTKGSSNWEKARVKVARQYEKIANQRKDFLQKESSKIINKYDYICVENLKITDMIEKNKLLARRIYDVSWSDFLEHLSFVSEYNDKMLIKINPYYASSQICSNCSYKNELVKNLDVREWMCPQCGVLHDRDVNAAKNILNEGLKMI